MKYAVLNKQGFIIATPINDLDSKENLRRAKAVFTQTHKVVPYSILSKEVKLQFNKWCNK